MVIRYNYTIHDVWYIYVTKKKKRLNIMCEMEIDAARNQNPVLSDKFLVDGDTHAHATVPTSVIMLSTAVRQLESLSGKPELLIKYTIAIDV